MDDAAKTVLDPTLAGGRRAAAAIFVHVIQVESAVTAEVTEIATRKVIAPAVNCSESVVRTLERLLEQARAGDFQGIAYATVGEGADLRTGWSELSNWLEFLGGVTVLQKRLMDAS